MTLALNALRKGIETHRLQQRKLVEGAPNIMIGVPTRDPKSNNGRFAPDFVWSLLQLQRPTNYSLNFECEWAEDKGPAENRESITERALQQGSKYLILIDDDMTFPYFTVERFIDDLDSLPDAAVVTAVIGKKRPFGEPEIFKTWNGGRYWDWKKNTVEEIWACGAACMAINLDYVRKMKKPYWVDESLDYKGAYSTFSEDLNFCRKVQDEAGGKVYLDSHIVCGHFDLKTGETYFPKSKEENGKGITMREAKTNGHRVFIVTGEGRTGTSAVSRILHEHFKIPMGYKNGDVNCEDREFVKLNENVIMGHYSFTFYLAHLEELVKKRNATYKEWGMKDPKTSYTLGTLLSLVRNAVIIRCTRAREQVVASLMRNYGCDEDRGIRIFMDRKIRLDNILDNRPHMVIDFSTQRTDAEIINELNKFF